MYVIISWLLTNSLNQVRIQSDTDEIVHKYIYLPSDFYSESIFKGRKHTHFSECDGGCTNDLLKLIISFYVSTSHPLHTLIKSWSTALHEVQKAIPSRETWRCDQLYKLMSQTLISHTESKGCTGQCSYSHKYQKQPSMFSVRCHELSMKK